MADALVDAIGQEGADYLRAVYGQNLTWIQNPTAADRAADPRQQFGGKKQARHNYEKNAYLGNGESYGAARDKFEDLFSKYGVGMGHLSLTGSVGAAPAAASPKGQTEGDTPTLPPESPLQSLTANVPPEVLIIGGGLALLFLLRR